MGRLDALDGWKAIAAAVGRCDRTCRAMANWPVDPLPVFKVGGIVRLNSADLDAWLDRRRAAASARSRGASEPSIEEHW